MDYMPSKRIKGDFIIGSNFYGTLEDMLRGASFNYVLTPVKKTGMPDIKDIIFNDPATIVFCLLFIH